MLSISYSERHGGDNGLKFFVIFVPFVDQSLFLGSLAGAIARPS